MTNDRRDDAARSISGDELRDLPLPEPDLDQLAAVKGQDTAKVDPAPFTITKQTSTASSGMFR
jgi:hypothetical protein